MSMYPGKLDTDRSTILQKYLRLHQEQEQLRQRLVIDPFTMPPPLRSQTSDSSSLSSSPPSATTTRCPTSMSPTRRHNRASVYMPSQPTSSAVSVTGSPVLSYAATQPDLEASILEAYLLELTHAMKATLTELLNCPSVRHAPESADEGDLEFRNWVQTRLMEKELELKAFRKTQGRRRTSSMSDFENGSPERSFGPETLQGINEEGRR